MYLPLVVCLLSAVVALPTPEELHANLPALSPPSKLKSEKKDNSGVKPIPPPLDVVPESEEAKNPSESAEKPNAEKDEDKHTLDDVTKAIQKDYKALSEPNEFEKKPEQPQELQYEESKEGDEDDGPIIVQLVQKPFHKSPGISDWWPFPNFHLPWPSSRFASKLLNGDQRHRLIYIVRETDLASGDWY